MKLNRISVLCAVLAVTAVLPAAADLSVDAQVSHTEVYTGNGEPFYLKIGLTGIETAEKERTPVNLSLVLDRSGSMSGDKIINARKAVTTAVSMLGNRDILSFLTYSDGVQVHIPAAPVTNLGLIENIVREITPGGSTALFAGVSWGAGELRKYRNSGRVNRVILLSDGIANVGPASPGELGSFGGALKEEGISVTTIGLGIDFNEDLMFQLAKRSDGNHYFVERPEDLARIFLKEFQNSLSVAAQNITVTITFPEGIRPVRSLGREAEIIGNTVTARLNQVYGNQEKYLLLELTSTKQFAGGRMNLADVTVTYSNSAAGSTNSKRVSVDVGLAGNPELMKQRVNNSVMADVVLQIAAANSEEAMRLRDRGQVEEAKQVLLDNASFLKKNARELDSEKLSDYSDELMQSSSNLAPDEWDTQRKELRSFQYEIQNQQED